jgi:alkylation response protein AidB-like acyl-CoA dehydrogenase
MYLKYAPERGGRQRSIACRAASNQFTIERFYRDVHQFRIHEGTGRIQRLVIALDMIREARR